MVARSANSSRITASQRSSYLCAIIACVLATLNAIPAILFAQAHTKVPDIQWQRCLGGSSADYAFNMIQTADGGFALCGYVTSTDGDVVGHHGGGEDAWVAKLSPSGNLEWAKCYGGSNAEEANSIAQTADGGYLVAVRTESFDSQVIGNHGLGDAWILKLNDTGAIEWSQCYGGDNYDDPCSIIQATDGSYVFAGWTRSETPNEVDQHHGQGDDAWVVKIKTSSFVAGFEKWFGGMKRDVANSIVQTSEGGYIFAGFTYSSDGDVSDYLGGAASDVWVVKISPTGFLDWEKCFGGSENEWANSIIQTSDGGYALAGISYSTDGDIVGNHGGGDAWVAKISRTGLLQWQKCLGGSGLDMAWSIVQTPEGGYAIGGYTASNDGDVKGNHGGQDVWLVKLDSVGDMEWQKCMGGSGIDQAISMVRTKDGGYALAGNTGSTDGDIRGYHGNVDAWVVKLNSDASVAEHLPTSTAPQLTTHFGSDRNALLVDFSVESAGEVTLDLTNVTGEQLRELRTFVLQSVPQQSSFDIGKLGAGTYYVTLHAAGESRTAAFEVIK